MNSVRIQTGDTERIEALILDGSLTPLTGLTDILISIRRVSDGYWLDFNDYIFKSSGWAFRQTAMTETDSTNDPGTYHYDFNTGGITNPTADDTYQVRVDQSPGTDAGNVPLTGEIKVGQVLDDIEEVRTGLLRALGLGQEDSYMDNTVYSTYSHPCGGDIKLLTSARIRIYSDPDSVGTSNDVIATYNITATWTDDELDTYGVVQSISSSSSSSSSISSSSSSSSSSFSSSSSSSSSSA